MLQAIFTSGIDEIEVGGLFQWDRGQILALSVPEGLPSTYQVHFTFKGSSKALNVTVFDSTEVAIPDELLTQPRDLIAFVYLIGDDDSGETVKIIHLPVTPRAKPEDYSELPQTFQERVDSMLVSINEKANYSVATSDDAKKIATESAAASADYAGQAAASAAAAEKAALETQEAAEVIEGILQLTDEEIAALMGDIDCGTFEEG